LAKVGADEQNRLEVDEVQKKMMMKKRKALRPVHRSEDVAAGRVETSEWEIVLTPSFFSFSFSPHSSLFVPLR
jgi:hypothetical protein